MRLHRQCGREISITQYFDQIVLADEAARNQHLDRDLRLPQLQQTAQVDHRVLSTEDVREATLRDAAVQRHLAAFKTAHLARARTRKLSFMSTGRCLAVPRTHSAPNALLRTVRILRWMKIT